MLTLIERMRTMTAAEPVDAPGLYRLMAWLSPGFPIGSYTYSHGLEYAVEAGLAHDGPSCLHWIETIVRHGAGAIDAGLVRASWEAVQAGDDWALCAVAERASAWRATAETAAESHDQGRAFVIALAAGWPDPRREAALSRLSAAGIAPAYSVAVGMAAACDGISLAATLRAYLQAFAASLVSAAVRLVPLGQSEGVRLTARLEAAVAETAALALAIDLDDLGTSAWMTEWTSMRHEDQYTRLFRS